MARKKKSPPKPEAYDHPESTSPMRPEVGVQAQFKKKLPPTTYRYDSSLAPELVWDESAMRAYVESLIARVLDAKSIEEAKAAARELKALGQPFLNWSGKAERPEFSVPALPLFIHERLSTEAIVKTLKGHRRDKQLQQEMFQLFADPQHSVTDQVLKAYEYQDDWVNRLILGDSLVVMNSLLGYEGMAGKVQMIYMDPPYGVKFGSNFQPFIRRRDVKHGDDGDFSREPEMVKAYRDTWELGLHSYLSYLRDRLLLCRELLTESGSIFVQIGDENLHHVREIMDEVFGDSNSVSIIPFTKTRSTAGNLLSSEFDYLVWYAKSIDSVKYTQVYIDKDIKALSSYKYIESPDRMEYRTITEDERASPSLLPKDWRVFQISNLASGDPGRPEDRIYTLNGVAYDCGPSKHWGTTNPEGIDRLVAAGRILPLATQLNYKRYLTDTPVVAISNSWSDTGSAGFSSKDPKVYVVQTDTKVAQRCILMTTDPGDLVFDLTCGSGTTAFVAEEWGRRWITCDVSRVPLALARQRLLTGTYDYYQLKEPDRGPAGGFVYRRKRNRKGEEVGGIVPRITLRSIARDESPEEVVLVDRPGVDKNFVRVSGPFVVEAVIPTPVDLDADGVPDDHAPGGETAQAHSSHIDRMVAALRACPVLEVPGGEKVEFEKIRPLSSALVLNAEGQLKGKDDYPVAFLIGPEHGAVSERMVHEAAKEVGPKGFRRLYVIGFEIQAKARQMVDSFSDVTRGVPGFWVQATPDLTMGDLLKNMRSSQLFSVCGLPDVVLFKTDASGDNGERQYRVKVLGLDTVNPETMDHDEMDGNDLPAWFLDTDYNGQVFHVSQAFFPRTRAWDSLKKALKADYDESVWAHLSSVTSAPFPAGEEKRIAVKVIDDRGNELLVEKGLDEAVEPGHPSLKKAEK